MLKLRSYLSFYFASTDLYKKKILILKQILNTRIFDSTDFLKISYVEGIPQQPFGSLDCGIYMLAYAEYLSYGLSVPWEDIKVDMLRCFVIMVGGRSWLV